MWPRDRYAGPGGGLYAVQMGVSTQGQEEVLYAGPGGGLYAGPCSPPYMSNRPPCMSSSRIWSEEG